MRSSRVASAIILSISVVGCGSPPPTQAERKSDPKPVQPSPTQPKSTKTTTAPKPASQAATGLVSRSNFAQPVDLDSGSYYFDRVGGVIWRKCDLGKSYVAETQSCSGKAVTASWPEAVAIVQKLNEQGFEGATNWRLPASSDLAKLFLNDPIFQEIKSMRYRKYGLGPTDFYADYANGRPINFGGPNPGFSGPGEQQCNSAGRMLRSIFYRANNIRPITKIEVAPTDYHRWMSDNIGWRNGEKSPPELNTWQSPRSINLAGSCENIVRAYYKDTPDFQLPGYFVAHAELPITIVRGGETPQEWDYAQFAIKDIQNILDRSRADQQVRIRTVAAFYGAVASKIKEILSTPINGSQSMPSANGTELVVFVDAECVAGGYCPTTDLRVDGPVNVESRGPSNSVQLTARGTGNVPAGQYGYSFTIDGKCRASGNFTYDGRSQNIRISHYRGCAFSDVRQN